MTFDFPNILRDSIWHTTSVDRYREILAHGNIVVEPRIGDRERWSTACGSQLYPYVRTLGGISLFDFNGFDPVAYEERYPLSSWREFVPYRSMWGASIWIEIASPSRLPGFISGLDLLAQWKRDQVGNRIMPVIEAAHIGSISTNEFGRVVISDECGFHDCTS